LHNWEALVDDILAPLHFPKHPFAMEWRTFYTTLTNMATAAIAMVLMAAGHTKGWPLVKGGSGKLDKALAAYFVSLSGVIQTNLFVQSLSELPSAHTVLFDVTPKQLLQIAGYNLSGIYKWQLNRFRYGMGVFKLDWALDAPIPWNAKVCRDAGTIHLGNTLEEIALSEKQTAKGIHAEKPFELLAQASVVDATRAPAGKHTAWAYCHIPNGSIKDMTTNIEMQV
jgi:phytoene dehydrogenase-like protein